MPQFDEISPLNEICALAFKKKKNSIQTNKRRGVKKKQKTELAA